MHYFLALLCSCAVGVECYFGGYYSGNTYQDQDQPAKTNDADSSTFATTTRVSTTTATKSTTIQATTTTTKTTTTTTTTATTGETKSLDTQTTTFSPVTSISANPETEVDRLMLTQELLQNTAYTADLAVNQLIALEQSVTRLTSQCNSVTIVNGSIELHILGNDTASKHVQSLLTNTTAWLDLNSNSYDFTKVVFSVGFFNFSAETTKLLSPTDTSPFHQTMIKQLSRHISINVYESHDGPKLSVPVKFAVENKLPSVMRSDIAPVLETSKILELNVRCEFIDTRIERYSSAGCVATVDGSTILCSCNHTTVFAVLLSMRYIEIPDNVKITSVVTESVSVACLFVTILLLVKLKRHIRSDRTIVQINLSASLLLLHVGNLLHDSAKQNAISCQVVAVSTHFFMLASSMWMMLEGITLVLKTTTRSMQLSREYQQKLNAVRLVIGWVVPLLVVAIAMAAGYSFDTYMDKLNMPYGSSTIYRQCWLQSDMLLYSVMVPIGIVLLANTTILVKVAYFVHLKSSQANRFKPAIKRRQSFVNYDDISATLKAVLTLLPVLGLPMIISFFVGFGENTSVALLYINVLVNGLQGFFLFLLYCINSRVVRRLILRKTFLGDLKRPSDATLSVSAGTAMTSRNGSAVTAISQQ